MRTPAALSHQAQAAVDKSEKLLLFLIRGLKQFENSCTKLQSEVAIKICSVSLFVLPADKSALMFEYLNERENVNIFYQTF